MESIKQVLMRRDGMTADEAEVLIDEAKEVLAEYIENGEMDYAENICQDYFGLELDYLMELMPY
jgi:hypothetical protein